MKSYHRKSAGQTSASNTPGWAQKTALPITASQYTHLGVFGWTPNNPNTKPNDANPTSANTT
jgi:hypothetical protein